MDNSSPPSPHVKAYVHFLLKGLYLLGIVFGGSLAVLNRLVGGAVSLSLVFAGFAVLSVWAFLLSFTTVEANGEVLIVNTPHGMYRIGWNEIGRIETDGAIMAFLGENKCLPISLRMLGKGKWELLDFVAYQIRKRDIEVKSLSPRSTKNRNTKVPRLEA